MTKVIAARQKARDTLTFGSPGTSYVRRKSVRTRCPWVFHGWVKRVIIRWEKRREDVYTVPLIARIILHVNLYLHDFCFSYYFIVNCHRNFKEILVIVNWNKLGQLVLVISETTYIAWIDTEHCTRANCMLACRRVDAHAVPNPTWSVIYTDRVTEFRGVAKFRDVVRSCRDKFQHARSLRARHAQPWPLRDAASS